MDKSKKFTGNNLLWILFLVTVLYCILAGIFEMIVMAAVQKPIKWSPAMHFVNEYYTPTIGAIIFLFLICWVVKKNHFILRSFLPAGKGKNHKIQVIEDTYEPTQNNTGRNLLFGLFLGFLTNFACILCAMLHGDVNFTLNFNTSMIPVLIYALIMVFIQSTSEELWCRGFMYERILIHYPLWVAVLINGIFFGLLHIFNPGVSVMAILGIVICGFSYSLLRWYTGSIWITMGIHTMWNFTQNFIFGLPNSGLVSEVSVFNLDAVNAVSNLIYNYEFGVEAAIPALVVDALIGVVCIILAKRNGRLGELNMSYEKIAAAKAAENSMAETAPEAAPETV